MFKKLKKIIFNKDLKEGNKIVINCEKLENRVASLENGVLEEYNIERLQENNVVGCIYNGIVKNIELGLKAMFVDIGYEKNAFLHFWDAIPAALDKDLELVQRKNNRGSRKKKNNKITSKDIPNIYPIGSEVLVQVTKGPIGTKGPRVTTNISLAGRFLVLMPLHEQFGISRKIDNIKERIRLRKILEKLTLPENMGVIMRTIGQGQKTRYFIRDLSMLLEQWNEIEKNNKEKKAPSIVFKEPDLIERTVRDFLTDDIEEVICDSEVEVERMKNLVSKISRRAKNKINHYPYNDPIFIRFGIQKQIENAFHRQVWLDCGGYIVIDETEALIAIDVNTGRNKGSKNVEKMILETNIEAAKEVARQLRLRNIGGIVIIDFIDMRNRRDQNAVYRTMRERLEFDKAKTQVSPISALGIMEMTRQRLHESLVESLYDTCPYCTGKGIVKSTVTMSVEIQQKIRAAMTKYRGKYRDIIIVVHPDVINRLRNSDDQHLVDLQKDLGGKITFRSDPTFHREQLIITDKQTGAEVRV